MLVFDTTFSYSFLSRSLSSIFFFADAVRACRISSNFNLIILVSSSSSLLIFFMTPSSFFSFLSTFSWVLIGSMALICISSDSKSFPSLTFIKLSYDLCLWKLSALSLNVSAVSVEFSYISSDAFFIVFINPRLQFLLCSSIFIKFIFISVVHLLVLFKMVSCCISICASSLSTFIFSWFLNFAALSFRFCFPMVFLRILFRPYLFHVNINPVSLLSSSSVIVTNHLFPLSVYVEKRCLV